MGNSISVAESTAHLITHKTTETEQQQTQNEVVIPVIEVPVPKSEVIYPSECPMHKAEKTEVSSCNQFYTT